MGDPRSDHRDDEQMACEAYGEYRDSIRGPALPPAPRPWQSLDALIAAHEAGRRRWTWAWWLVPAFGAVLIAVVLIPHQASVKATELLTRSAGAEAPTNRMISMRVRGRVLLRPAVLVTADPMERDPDLARLEKMFNAAGYTWREPLSARSFQSWRNARRSKRDTVSVIRAGGVEQAYRVRTESSDGVLRSASLTLRARDFLPTGGAFQFEKEEPLEMDEAPPPVQSASRQSRTAPRREALVETPATPADALHVLAALNEIGADVGEPIDVSEDAQHHVVVRAAGLSDARRQQVTEALRPLNGVRLDLDAGPSSTPAAGARPATAERYSTNIPGPLRQQFESRLGGAIAFQEMTDRVLDASGSAVARAHAIEVLDTKFPPGVESSLAIQDRELLRKLRQRHMVELGRLVDRIRTDLRPLLPGPLESPTHESLVGATQEIDGALNRLLAGSYSQTSGEGMLRALAGQFERLDRAIRIQRDAR
jgi:hypothetical protein